MRELMRLIATVSIWGAFAAVAGVALTGVTGPVSNMNGGEIVALMAVLMTGVIAITYAVWHSGFSVGRAENNASLRSIPSRSKSKRMHEDRVGRLIDDLDDDEIYELETLLLARDREARELDR